MNPVGMEKFEFFTEPAEEIRQQAGFVVFRHFGKAAFKPTWGAIAAKISSFNLSSRSRTMGIMEGGVDASDLAFPVLAGVMLQYLSLGPLMLVRAALAIVAEIYGFVLMRKYKI